MPPLNNGTTPAPATTPDWANAGEDYQPGDIGVPGLETVDEALLATVIADAGQAVKDKKNAKKILEVVIQSVKTGVNLFHPGLFP